MLAKRYSEIPLFRKVNERIPGGDLIVHGGGTTGYIPRPLIVCI
jgi:hypothetical protein